MTRLSRRAYVVQKLANHLGKFSPDVRVDILREVAEELRRRDREPVEIIVTPATQRPASLPSASQRRMPRRGGVTK
jgi:hypothetical protein